MTLHEWFALFYRKVEMADQVANPKSRLSNADVARIVEDIGVTPEDTEAIRQRLGM